MSQIFGWGTRGILYQNRRKCKGRFRARKDEGTDIDAHWRADDDVRHEYETTMKSDHGMGNALKKGIAARARFLKVGWPGSACAALGAWLIGGSALLANPAAATDPSLQPPYSKCGSGGGRHAEPGTWPPTFRHKEHPAIIPFALQQ